MVIRKENVWKVKIRLPNNSFEEQDIYYTADSCCCVSGYRCCQSFEDVIEYIQEFIGDIVELRKVKN